MVTRDLSSIPDLWQSTLDVRHAWLTVNDWDADWLVMLGHHTPAEVAAVIDTIDADIAIYQCYERLELAPGEQPLTDLAPFGRVVTLADHLRWSWAIGTDPQGTGDWADVRFVWPVAADRPLATPVTIWWINGLDKITERLFASDNTSSTSHNDRLITGRGQ